MSKLDLKPLIERMGSHPDEFVLDDAELRHWPSGVAFSMRRHDYGNALRGVTGTPGQIQRVALASAVVRLKTLVGQRESAALARIMEGSHGTGARADA